MNFSNFLICQLLLILGYGLLSIVSKVLYDDGDVEVLRLEKECWELVGGVQKPVKVCFSL